MRVTTRLTVLYVEDDEGDRFFMQRAFQAASLGSSLKLVADGNAALEYLSGSSIFADRVQHPVPGFVLLDLNLPQVSGFEVLEWIRNRPDYASLPVVIFSSSSHPEDLLKAKALGANDYWVKPRSGKDYSSIVAAVCEQLHSLSSLTDPAQRQPASTGESGCSI